MKEDRGSDPSARLDRALLAARRAMLGAHDRDALTAEVCRIMVEHGGLAAALIRLRSTDRADMVPVAQVGPLEAVQTEPTPVSAVPRAEASAGTHTAERGPAAGAAGSAAAFPLYQNGRAVGAVEIVAGAPLFFTAEVVELFGDLGLDLARALERLAREAELERRVAQYGAELEAANARLDETQHLAQLGSWELDLASNVLSWSKEIFRIFEIDAGRFGASYEAFLAMIHPQDRERVDRAFRVSVQQRTPYHVEHRLLMPDGRIKHVCERGKTFYDENGRPLRSIGTVQDVTAAVLAEREAHAARELLQCTIDSTPDWIFVKDRAHRFLLVNRSFAAAQGLRPGDMVGRPDSDFWALPLREGDPARGIRGFHHDDRAALSGELVRNPRDPATFADGSMHIFDTFKGPLRDADGRVYGVLCYARDVTEQVAAVEALAAREAELRELNASLERRVAARTVELESARDFIEAVFDTVGGLAVVLDRDGRIVRFNRACELTTGYRADELLGRCVLDLLVPVAERGPVKEVFAALRVGRFPSRHDHHWITKEGQQRLISWSNTALTDSGGEVRYVVATGIDVTEQRAAEEELRRFRAALDATADGVYLIDRASMRYVDCNRVAWQNLGLPNREALLALGPHDIKPEISREQLAARYDAILAGADRSGVIETVHRRADGSTFPVEVFVRALTDGNAPLLVAVARDISERRRAEKALAESRARYESALRQTHDGFCMAGLNGRLLDVNDAYCRLVGYGREELLSMSVADLEALETPEEIAAHTTRILAAGSDVFETRHRRKDGTTLPLDVSATSAEFDGQSVLLAFLRSAEPRKRAEAERLAQEREQRDTLVREVHHRIKNNLQGVVGLLRQHSAAHPELRAAFDEAVSQVSAMAVVHGLQSKDGAERIYLCDMVEAVAQAVAGITGVPVSTRTARAETGPIVIAGEEAVPLALIHNELMINAAKHGRLGDGGVRVTVRRVEKGAVVELTNAVPGLPPGFDWDAGRGLGTGLHLVRSLMPRAGARLEFAEHDGFVTATLSLSSPTIVSGQDGSTQVCC